MAKSPVNAIDRLWTLLAVVRGVSNGWLMLLSRRSPKGKAYIYQFLIPFFRSLMAGSTIGVDRLMNPFDGTTKQYLDFAKRKNLQPDTLVMDGGLKAHWVGASNAERVLLYFHGGGFVLPALPGHFEWLFKWSQEASKQKSTSVLVLSYSLAPEAQYPVQLQQMVALLNHMLTKGGKRPSQLLIGGDSAGGNMTLAVLSHLLHPHPQVPQVHLDEPLAGALLISPWVEMVKTDAIWNEYRYNDIISDAALPRWAGAYRGSAPFDNYIMPSQTDDQWFKGLDKVISKVWIWAGGIERLLGSINEIAQKLERVHPNVKYMVEAGAIHIDAYFEATILKPRETEGTKLIGSWISSA